MAEITIVTKAYNTGNRIFRCVDSVLNQSFHDFIFVIIDNASADGTKEVLENYAKQDSRVQVYRNEENNVSYLNAIKTYVHTEYYMVLDHDDWLEPTALELLLQASKGYQADLVFGKSNLRNDNEDLVDIWGINEKLVLTNNCLSEHFDHMYWQMRTLWGILVRTDMLDRLCEEKINEVRKGGYAVDTVTTMNLVFEADKVVFLPEIIHNYRMHSDSENGMFRRNQFIANWKIMDVAKEYLIKYGTISDKNQVFLNRVYSSAICDTIQNAIVGTDNLETIFEMTREIITDIHTKEMVLYSAYFKQDEQKRFLSLFGNIVFGAVKGDFDSGWLLLNDWMGLIYPAIIANQSDLRNVALKCDDDFKLLCIGEFDQFQERLWMKPANFSSKFYDLFLTHENQTPVELAERLLWLLTQSEVVTEYEKELVLRLAKQNLILQKYGSNLIETECRAILLICCNRFGEVLEECITKIEADDRRTELLDLTLSLAAIEKKPQVFVAVRKLQFIEAYNENDNIKTEELITDLLQMCPEDEEVKEWSLIVGNR